ncbi:MAG: DNA polymerase III subunit gamma/tau [Magnetococcales bacterium]|nr:DNA polymerase III subunit gamma/tau [Magnetococcales bacterium]
MSSYVVLARRWRPRSFSALVGQDNVTQALKNAMLGGRIPHAFLFTGIRGVGKTTLARLLSMCLNCESGVTPEPCGSCSSCTEIIAGVHPDVMELDAGSRTKVEQMRELLDLVVYSPSTSRYKVFILDEVHMLSKNSFNALLKTLEEPPAHVKFIFATTESRKIPATIVSRCQRYDLKRVAEDPLIAHMANILTKEKVEFEESALSVVAKSAEGSVRDALSLLDQAISHGDGGVKLAEVTELLGLSNRAGGLELLGHLLSGNGEEVLKSTAQFYNDGTEPEALINDLLDMLHAGVRMQVVAAGQSAGKNDEMAQQLRQATQSSSQEHLQMAYQVLLRGSQDLRLAENQQQALEMLLLRVAYLKPVPDIGQLIKMATKAGENSVAGSGETQGAAGGFAGLPASSASPLPSHPKRGKREPTQKKQLIIKEPITSWQQLISSVKNDAPELAMKLEQQVACLDYHDAGDGTAPRMVLQLVNDCFGPPDQVKVRIVEYLEKTGVSGDGVVVEPASEESRPETIGEQATRVKSEAMTKLVEQTREHPVVRELSARFQIEILKVEPLNDKSVQ